MGAPGTLHVRTVFDSVRTAPHHPVPAVGTCRGGHQTIICFVRSAHLTSWAQQFGMTLPEHAIHRSCEMTPTTSVKQRNDRRRWEAAQTKRPRRTPRAHNMHCSAATAAALLEARAMINDGQMSGPLLCLSLREGLGVPRFPSLPSGRPLIS